MTDQERIDADAEQHAECCGAPCVMTFRDVHNLFVAGVAWRDANPSPKVQALVEALTVIAKERKAFGTCPVIAHTALKAWSDK